MSRTSTKLAMFLLQIFAASAFLAGTAFSQVADSLPVRETNSLRAGAWALQFQVGDDFTLGSFDGATFSIKKHTSAGGAWRLGVTLSGDISRVQSATSYDQDPYYQVDGIRDDANSQSISLGLTRIIYPRSPSVVNFFYGLGPRLTYSRSHEKIRPLNSQTTIRDDRSWVVGVGLVIGAEVFPYKSLGLSGEYGPSLTYRWQKHENSSFWETGGTRSKLESKSSGYTFANGGLRLGVSVYW